MFVPLTASETMPVFGKPVLTAARALALVERDEDAVAGGGEEA